MKLEGNTILITGGTSGIGLAFAEQYMQAGSKVIICGRRADRLEAIQKKYPGIITRACDIANEGEREELSQWAISTYPDLNILMNNAGIQLTADLSKPLNMDRVRMEIETNLIAPLHLGSLFAQHLAGKKESAIMNITSGLAFAPIAFMPVYCATKAAMHSATLSLRHQLRNTNIQVFEIIPPSVDTELGHDRRTDKSQSHGGMPIADFITEAIQNIREGVLEAPIAAAKGLRAKREELFPMMNK